MASGVDAWSNDIQVAPVNIQDEIAELASKVSLQKQNADKLEKKLDLLTKELDSFHKEVVKLGEKKVPFELKANKFRRGNDIETLLANCSLEKLQDVVKRLTVTLVGGLDLNPIVDHLISSDVLSNSTLENFEKRSEEVSQTNLNRWFLRNVLQASGIKMYQQFILAIHKTTEEVKGHADLCMQIMDALNIAINESNGPKLACTLKLAENMDEQCLILDSKTPVPPDVCNATFEFILPKGKQPRAYQEELARPGMEGQNYIVCAPTGTGKTLIVSMVISSHLKRVPNGRVVFVVNRIALAEQQCKEVKSFIPDLKAEHITRDCGAQLHISAVLTTNQMVVCTSGILLNELIMQELSSTKRVSLEDITLLVFDECHNAKKNNPYAVIMERYIQLKAKGTGNLPQVVGLTASPGAGENPSGEVEKTLEHLQELCALLDALGGIKTVQANVTELVHYTNQPDFDLLLTKSRSECDPFIQLLNSTVKPLEEWVESLTGHKAPLKRHLVVYKDWVASQLNASERRFGANERDLRSTLTFLKWYYKALRLHHELNQTEAVKFLQANLMFPDEPLVTTIEKTLLKRFENFCLLAQNVDHQEENFKLQRLKELLRETFEKNPSTRGIIFVTTIVVAHGMCNWLKCVPELKELVRPGAITGKKLEAGGMSRASQQNIIDQFAEGSFNLLVSTSVLEEGINVPACNLVVRYNHVTGEIARVQSQGRARAKGSRCYAIIEIDSTKVYLEQENREREKLTLEALEFLPEGDRLKEEIEKAQKSILLAKEMHEKMLQNKKLLEPTQITVVCRHCDLELFWGGDLRKLAGAHHVVITDDIYERCVVKMHDRARPAGDFQIALKLCCKSCDMDIGVIMRWAQRHLSFPAIKCQQVLFWAPSASHSKIPAVKLWRDVPFIVPAYV